MRIVFSVHPRQLHAARYFAHFLFCHFINLLHCFVDSCYDEILEHFYIIWIDSFRRNGKAYDILAAIYNNLDCLPPAVASTVRSLSSSWSFSISLCIFWTFFQHALHTIHSHSAFKHCSFLLLIRIIFYKASAKDHHGPFDGFRKFVVFFGKGASFMAQAAPPYAGAGSHARRSFPCRFHFVFAGLFDRKFEILPCPRL